MEFWLQQNSDKFQLPVKPSDYTVSVSHKNTVVNVIQVGDINLIGNTGLREISLKSFFPAKAYNFSNNAGRKQPLAYVEKIESWRKSGTPIRVIITGTLNMEATLIVKGKKTINDVPPVIREQVKQILIDLDLPELAE